MTVHQIGIRELVEFLLRTGDLSLSSAVKTPLRKAVGFTEKFSVVDQAPTPQKSP